jgi:uncharacterized membrane protein
MLWFILALLAAVFDATYYALIKKFVKGMNQFVMASGVYLTAGIVLIIYCSIRGYPSLGKLFLPALIGTVIINVVTATIYYKALRTSDISLILPMIAFTPVFLIVTSPLILGEHPSTKGIIGILFIVAGSYLLHLDKKKHGFFGPIKSIFTHKGTLLMFLVAVLWSVSLNFDKLQVMNSDPTFAAATMFLSAGSVFLIISRFKVKNLFNEYKKTVTSCILPGICLVIVACFINTAFTMSIVPYVIAIKRVSILISVGYGFFMFKEKHTTERLLGAFTMFVGMLMVMLFA